MTTYYPVNPATAYTVSELAGSWYISAGGRGQIAGTLKSDDPDGTYADAICIEMREELERTAPADRCPHDLLRACCPDCWWLDTPC
jgi:hypothetical protein